MTEVAPPDPRLLDWKDRFDKAPLARQVVLSLEGRSQEIWRRTFDLLKQGSPEYRNAVDDEFTAESRSHCGELLETIVAVAAGRSRAPDPFAFVRRHAEWRARHHVPLVASLHAYRLAHKTYWSFTREPLAAHRKRKQALHALAMLSDFWIELFEAVGATLEEAHAAEEARVVAQNTRAYAGLMDDLLNGREPASLDAGQLLALCGIRPGMQMTVAVIRPFPASNEKHLDAEVTLRSLVRLLHQSLPASVFGKLIDLRNGEIVVIASSDGSAAAKLLRHLGRIGFGRRAGKSLGAASGVGLDKPGMGALPEALSEARMALEFAGPARPLLGFANLDLAEFVIQQAGDPALRLVPAWVRDAHASAADAGLLRTIHAFAECSLHVKETARRLGVHTNTVYFRLNQVRQRSGIDPRTFAGISLLLTSLRLLDARAARAGHAGNGKIFPL